MNAITTAPLAHLIHNKKKRVSRKQLLWLKRYIATGNATESARKVYRISYTSAQMVAHDNLAKLNYPEYLEVAGITDNVLTHKLSEGLDANTDKNKPDYLTRHKYLETAYKLKKRLDQPVSTTVIVDKMLVLDGTNTETQPDIQPITQDTSVIETKP